MITRAVWLSSNPSMERWFLKYETIISFFTHSNWLEKCFSLAVRQNPWQKLNLGSLYTFFPSRMRCKGGNSRHIVIANVPVIQRLSELPPILTLFAQLKVIVSLASGTYFNSIWSRFSIIDNRILCLSTLSTISWNNKYWISFLEESGMFTANEVFRLFLKPIFRNMLWVQKEEHTLTSLTSQGWWSRGLMLWHLV